jgi:hypothetical protein
VGEQRLASQVKGTSISVLLYVADVIGRQAREAIEALQLA